MNQRITKPLIKFHGSFRESSFEEAFTTIANKFKNITKNETLLLCSGNYSNEFLYQLQKFSRTALKTNALSALDYYRRGTDFFADKNDIVPFAELYQANYFFCMFDKKSDNETLKAINEILPRCPEIPKYWFNEEGFLHITDFYSFFRSVNLYILQNNLEKGIYVNGLGKNYNDYKEKILLDDLTVLLSKNNLEISDIQKFVVILLNVSNPVFIVWEKFLSAEAYHELENLCMLVEIQAKPAAGFLCIKGDINSQGLFDMGFFPHIAPGGEALDETIAKKMEDIYGMAICSDSIDVAQGIDNQSFKNVFIGNPDGEPIDENVKNQVKKSEFSILHTAFMSEECDLFDIILPANLPEELSGTYTDSAKVPHNFEIEENKTIEFNNLQQLALLSEHFNVKLSSNKDEIFLEYISFMNAGCHSARRHFFR